METNENILHLHVLASGSKGNCSIVENTATGRAIMIDCGVTKRDFFARCEALSLDPASIEAILITHEHTDHTKGLGVVTRGLAKVGLHPTLFVSDKVRAASTQIQAIEETMDMRAMNCGDDLSIAGMSVHVFPTSHDAAESFGFRFDNAGDSVGFMTDTGTVTGAAHEALQNVRVLGLESNHDPFMLKYGDYPYSLKQRIASDRGHLSNEQAGDELRSLLSNRLQTVIALHISENNNTYDLPEKTFAEVLSQECHPAHALVGKQRTPVDAL